MEGTPASPAAAVCSRTPLLYLAPWVDYGGTAKGTVDWFKWLDRERWAPSLMCTQAPSRNRLLPALEPYADEVWVLPELMAGGAMPDTILDFVESRGVRVVHIMNSRLGYELLPDLVSLPDPPKVVVQLHVEEASRAGYVRYVTTRYANLVDAFSVTSEHLKRDMVEQYDVSPAKCRVIYTGVDADEEFSPERVAPIEAVQRRPGIVDVLYLGRLVDQKDPMLMVDVVEALARRRTDFRIHVVGYGELEDPVRAAVAERGLEELVLFHGPTAEPARWFAACDLQLMTSIYEGVPYVVFEAMAMEVPTVAPALPGMVELMGDGSGILVHDREDVTAYVDALDALVGDPGRRVRLGREGREAVLDRLTLRRMAEEHEDLYRRLLGEAQGAARPGMVV